MNTNITNCINWHLVTFGDLWLFSPYSLINWDKICYARMFYVYNFYYIHKLTFSHLWYFFLFFDQLRWNLVCRCTICIQINKKKYQMSPNVIKGQFVYLVKIVYIKHACITNFISIDQRIRWKHPKVTIGHQRSIYAFG